MRSQMKWRLRALGTFVFGWLTGVAAGGVTALLLAPQSGTETQRRIRQQAGAMRDEADQVIEQRMQIAEGKISALRRSLSDRLKQGAAALEPEEV